MKETKDRDGECRARNSVAGGDEIRWSEEASEQSPSHGRKEESLREQKEQCHQAARAWHMSQAKDSGC